MIDEYGFVKPLIDDVRHYLCKYFDMTNIDNMNRVMSAVFAKEETHNFLLKLIREEVESERGKL